MNIRNKNVVITGVVILSLLAPILLPKAYTLTKDGHTTEAKANTGNYQIENVCEQAIKDEIIISKNLNQIKQGIEDKKESVQLEKELNDLIESSKEYAANNSYEFEFDVDSSRLSESDRIKVANKKPMTPEELEKYFIDYAGNSTSDDTLSTSTDKSALDTNETYSETTNMEKKLNEDLNSVSTNQNTPYSGQLSSSELENDSKITNVLSELEPEYMEKIRQAKEKDLEEQRLREEARIAEIRKTDADVRVNGGLTQEEIEEIYAAKMMELEEYKNKYETETSSYGITGRQPIHEQNVIRVHELDYKDVYQPTGLSADHFNYLLEGTALEGLGQAFVDMENTWSVDGLFAMSVAFHESARGESRLARNKNNLFGMKKNASEWKSFNSKADNIMYFGEYLNLSMYKGKTVRNIGKIYCPPNTEHWYQSLNKYYNNFIDALDDYN